MAAVLWQYKRIALIKSLWRQEILLPEHSPNKGCSAAPHSTQRCSGWCQIAEESPGPWSAVVIKSLGNEKYLQALYIQYSGSYSHLTPSKKSLNHCAFKDILGPCHRIQRHHSPRESCSHGFQEEKNTNFLKIPYSKGIGILSSLGTSLPLFVTTSGKHPLSISIMCVFF